MRPHRARALTILALLALFGLIGLWLLLKPSEKSVLLKIHSTQTLTAHLSWGYDHGSVVTMSKRISPSEVPILIDLFFEGADPLGVELALSSQCGAGLDGLRHAADTRLADDSRRLRQLFDLRDIASRIAESALCAPTVRAQAKAFAEDVQGRIGQETTIHRQSQQREQDAAARRTADAIRAYVSGTGPVLPRPRADAGPRR